METKRCRYRWDQCENEALPGLSRCQPCLDRERENDAKRRLNGGQKRKNEAYFRTPHGRAMKQARIAKRRGALWVLYDAHKIFQEHEYTCYLCGLKFEGPEMLTKEHVIPISKGGPDAAFNVLPACKSCNSRKRDKFLWQLPFDPYDYPTDPNLLVVPVNGSLWTPSLLIPGTAAFEEFQERVA